MCYFCQFLNKLNLLNCFKYQFDKSTKYKFYQICLELIYTNQIFPNFIQMPLLQIQISPNTHWHPQILGFWKFFQYLRIPNVTPWPQHSIWSIKMSLSSTVLIVRWSKVEFLVCINIFKPAHECTYNFNVIYIVACHSKLQFSVIITSCDRLCDPSSFFSSLH